MVNGDADEADIGRARAGRARLWFGTQLAVVAIIGLALLYVGIANISRGDDVSMWVAVLIVYAVGSVLAVWLARRAVDQARR